MGKTKLEAAKDMATATEGLIENVSSMYNTCESEFLEDFGLYQVLSLLRITEQDLTAMIEQLEIGR